LLEKQVRKIFGGKRVQLKDHSNLHLRIIKNAIAILGKWWLWTTIAGPIASNDRNIEKKTRTDLETRILKLV
jgi:hypothetical protein